MPEDILELAGRLSAQGEPFVLATVVWRRAPTSGRAGAKALIRVGGEIDGWLGGACAGHVVATEAARALAERAPRLVVLDSGADEAQSLEGGLAPGAGGDPLVIAMGCASEGALGIYLEPVLPRPRLVAVGSTPVAAAAAAMASALGWRTAVVPEGEPLPALGEHDHVVVGSMGHGDEAALEAVLATPAAYVGLVASRRRAKSVLDALRGRGLSEETLARVHAPAGLDLGPLANEEIAVAVVAEIVLLRSAGER